MSLEFGKPDKATKEKPAEEVQAQNTPNEAENVHSAAASEAQPKASTGADAYDITDFITQKREGASTGERQKLEANEFNDEDLLNEAGYSEDGEPPITETTAEEIEEDQPTEISEEWLEIFAWAGVELTDEAMPLLLAYLHAEDSHQRFKLPPERKDKLRMAWIAFLRKVLPPMDDKQGLLLVIIMLYIENLILGIWKTAGRIMQGTFQWPNVWPFKRFNKKTEIEPEEFTAPSPAPQPQPISADEAALQPEQMQPAPSARANHEPMKFDLPKRKQLPTAEPQQQQQPEPTEKPQEPVSAPLPIEVNHTARQDPIDNSLFEKGKGHPKQDKKLQSSKNGRWYQIKADTFKGQKTFQAWMHAVGYYKTNERLNNPTNEELETIGKNTKK